MYYVVLLNTVTVIVSAIPTWTQTPYDTVAVNGGSAEMKCALSNLVPPSLPKWYDTSGSSHRQVSSGTAVITHQCPTCIITGTHSDGEYHLKMDPVSVTDDGTWKCTVGNAHPQSQEATLIILDESPICITEGAIGSNYEVITGTGVTLKCDLNKAAPPGELMWTENGQDTNHKGDRPMSWLITITKAKKDDRYNCKYSHSSMSIYPQCNRDIIFDVQCKYVYYIGPTCCYLKGRCSSRRV
ncbi:peroxidasin homolog [Saccoglossus kowalevskii]